MLAPVMHGSSAENHLRDVLGANKFSHGVRNAFPFQAHHLRAETLREAQVRCQRVLIGFFWTELPINVNHVQFRVHAPCHSCPASDEVLAGGIRRNAHCHALTYTPVFADLLRFHVRFEAAIDLLRHLAQGQFAKGNQVPTPKEILKRALDLIGAVHVSSLHAVLQGFGCQVNHDRLARRQWYPVRHSLPHDDARDRTHHRRNAFDVLNVEGGDYVDFSSQKLLYILVTLPAFASGNIGVREFIYQHDFGAALQDRVDVHFLENCAFVLDLLARDRLYLLGKLLNAFASVGFNEADDDILATAAPP